MTMRDRLRYRFDNLMARGVGPQVLLLAAVTVVLVAIGATAAVVLNARPVGDDDKPLPFVDVLWLTLMHAFDPGTLSGDSFRSWVYLGVMLVVTIGGIFVVSALIGVLNQGFGERLEALRRGRSRVVESGHTVVLGWSSKLFPLLGELAEANRNQRRACVVVLADRDKVEMDDEIASFLDSAGLSLRVVTRRGDSLVVDDLALAAIERSKAVVVLAPERGADGTPMSATEADAVVLKTLLAIRKLTAEHPVHLVAEIVDERTAPVARMVVGEAAALVQTGPLVSRLLVQTGRQSGLSEVYGELLDFAGSEIYVRELPGLVGVAFRDAVQRFATSTLIGVLTAGGELLLPPDLDRPFAAGDQVVAISEDDDRLVLDGDGSAVDAAAASAVSGRPDRAVAEPEHTLVLGTSPRLPLVLRELDGFMAPGSRLLVVGEGDPASLVAGLPLVNAELVVRSGDVTDRAVLDGLDATAFDRVIVLSETGGRSQDLADARTIVTLLHLRDIARGGELSVISEILDVRNRDLASSGSRDDFVVSNRLVSLVLSQIAENPHLATVLHDLMSRDGHELYLKPVTDYVRPGRISFATVCAAALQRGEVAVGVRTASSASGGALTVVNPAKSTMLALAESDAVVVLAES